MDIEIKYGTLGDYKIEGDELYGMYVLIAQSNVFIDIKEDKMQKQREEYAERISHNVEIIEGSLAGVIENLNKVGKLDGSLEIVAIGLYSNDPTNCEVYLRDDKGREGWSCKISNEFTLYDVICSE